MKLNIITSICNWFGKISVDKLLHYIAGYIVFDVFITLNVSFNFSFLLSTIISFVITSAFIVCKELIDQYIYKGFDWRDVIASYIGVITKILVLVLLIL